MLHLERAGAVQLLHLGALLHMVYDKDNPRFSAFGSARSIADGGAQCHLSLGRGVKTWVLFFFLQENGCFHGSCMKNELVLNHSPKRLPWSFHDGAFIF